MDEQTVPLTFRIDKDLKTAFERVAKTKDQTVSQLLRAYIRFEIEHHAHETAQKDLFKPSEAIKSEIQPKVAKKQKTPPVGSRSALMGMFKKKG